MHVDDDDKAYDLIQNMNSVMYSTFNFVFLLTLICMLYKIRAIEDTTRIKAESATVMVILSFFASIQLLFYYV
jgi:hypothetical protein